MNLSTNQSLAFPWPKPLKMRGPGVRVAVADPVWRGSVRLVVERWREATNKYLPIVSFDSVEQLGQAAGGGPLVDVVEVGADRLLATADWIGARQARRNLAVLLCRQLLRDDDREAASHLMRESGAAMVIATPRDLNLLTELISDVCSGQSGPSDPLCDLPLACWGPAWQQAR